MIRLDHEVGHWVAARNFQMYFEANSQSIGLEKDGEIVAGGPLDATAEQSVDVIVGLISTPVTVGLGCATNTRDGEIDGGCHPVGVKQVVLDQAASRLAEPDP